MRIVRGRTWIPLAAALACPLVAGCFASYGFAAGPTVDTRGEIGVQVSARGRIGVTFDDENAIYEGVIIAGAPPGATTAHVSPMVVGGYVHEFTGGDDPWGLLVELRARFQLAWEDGTFRAWNGAGLGISFLPALDVSGDGDVYKHLGVELEGYYASDGAAEVPEGGSAPEIGIFGVSLVFERIVLDDSLL